MLYHGGKSKLAKTLAAKIKPYLVAMEGRFVEPFMGAFNMVPALLDYIITAECYDGHPGLATLFESMLDGIDLPDTITEKEYLQYKAKRDWNDPITTIAAFGASFGGQEFSGFSSKGNRDYAAEAMRSLKRKFRKLDEIKAKVTFGIKDYLDLEIENSLVYCDPPYMNSAAHKTIPFDHHQFYEWAEHTSERNNIVLVSEFSCPYYWHRVWSKKRKITLGGHEATRVEGLFRVVSRCDSCN